MSYSPTVSVAPGPVDQLSEANLFDFTGPIVISYARSSITGDPRLSYRDAELTRDFSGREITRVDTPVGELVTVTLEEVVDAFVRTFSILVPRVTVPFGGDVELDAIGIETIDTSGAFVPAPGPEGVLQTYRVHDLHGLAQSVTF